MDGWGWCRSRRKTLAKLNSPEPRVSLNSIPEMEVIIITSSSGWRLRQLWLMSWSLFDVLLFFYVTLPRNLMPCQQSRTKPQMPTPAASPGPKQPRRRNSANWQHEKNKLASKPKRLGFIVCLGHVFVFVGPEVASRPKRLRPRRRHLQPRMLGRNSPGAETAQIVPRRQKKEPASKPKRLGFMPHTRSGLGRNSLDADTGPKQLGLANPPGVPPHNVPRLPPHNVSRELISIGTNNRKVRHHTDKSPA